MAQGTNSTTWVKRHGELTRQELEYWVTELERLLEEIPRRWWRYRDRLLAESLRYELEQKRRLLHARLAPSSRPPPPGRSAGSAGADAA